jgi:hypothetical protein
MATSGAFFETTMPFEPRSGIGTASGISAYFGYSLVMNAFETISIDVYPWAAPTDEQCA